MAWEYHASSIHVTVTAAQQISRTFKIYKNENIFIRSEKKEIKKHIVTDQSISQLWQQILLIHLYVFIMILEMKTDTCIILLNFSLREINVKAHGCPFNDRILRVI